MLTPPLALVISPAGSDDTARLVRSLASELTPDLTVLTAGPVAVVGEHTIEVVDARGAAAWNAAAAAKPDSDLLLIDGVVELAPGTVATIRQLAVSNPEAATVTTLGSSASYLSAPARNVPNALPSGGRTVADAAQRINANALRLHPRVPTALPHCALVRRAALQLVGLFDETLEPRDALADLCARATAAGMVHLVADELFVGVRQEAGAVTSWDGPAAERHPALAATVSEAATDRYSALARSLLAASVALEPLTVTVDARGLRAASGTVTHVLGLVEALAAEPELSVRALVSDDAPVEVRDRLATVPRLGLVAEGQADTVGRTHIVHRPWQVESLEDMALLDRFGERTVITNQDLIGYRTPSVFPDIKSWQEYRTVTRASLGLAAAVLFFTDAAAEDALADDLVAPERAFVTGLGAGHKADGEGVHPGAVPGDDRPFLLVLGARFRHKNVRFALELAAELRARHRWDGRLVIAGREVLHGSGSGDDAAWLLANPEHADAVIDLGAVSEAEKTWLMREAAAVVAPSTYEGFGLVPFEAAAFGTPCLVASVSSVADTLPAELALLVPWDPVASAEAVASVLEDGEQRSALVAKVRELGAEMSWASVAARHAKAYKRALQLPAPAAARLTADLARAEHDYWSVRDGIDDRRFELVRSDAPLLDDELVAGLKSTLTAPSWARRAVRALRLTRKLIRR